MDMQNDKRRNSLTHAQVNFSQPQKSSLPLIISHIHYGVCVCVCMGGGGEGLAGVISLYQGGGGGG